ncbi:MAG TPA: hypothetical protein VMB50_20510 [Myxococcales bacterium]|nr:hypothetical protein [Myxococcales bacterium]
MTFLSALLATTLGQAIVLRGEVPACPSPEQIAAALARVSEPAAAAGMAIEVERRGGVLHVALRDGHGRLLAEKSLSAGPDCAGLAELVAVTVAAWEADLLHGGGLAPLPEALPPVPPAPRSPPSPPRKTPPPAHLKVRPGLLLGVTESWNEGGFATGGVLRGTLRWGRFAAELGLWGESPRQLAAEPGTFSWERGGLDVGGSYALLELPVRVELVPRLTGALIGVQTSGFMPNLQRVDPDFGWGGAIRASVPLRVRPWLEVAALDWPILRQAIVEAPGLPQLNLTKALPSYELFVAVGGELEAR